MDQKGMRDMTNPRRKLRPREAANYLNLANSTLAKMRLNGTGPVFIKAGRVVLYDIQDLELWLDSHKRISTSQYGQVLN